MSLYGLLGNPYLGLGSFWHIVFGLSGFQAGEGTALGTKISISIIKVSFVGISLITMGNLWYFIKLKFQCLLLHSLLNCSTKC